MTRWTPTAERVKVLDVADRDSSELLTEAVLFAHSDLAGFRARVAIMAIDGIVLVLVAVPLLMLQGLYPTWGATTLPLMALSWWAYLGALKTTRFGTLGYRIMGFRLVGLDGEPASILRTTARFLLLHWGGLDTFWIFDDENRQTFRDKFAGTYVVRRAARPTGRGRVSYDVYFMLGAALPVPVVHPTAPTANARRV